MNDILEGEYLPASASEVVPDNYELVEDTKTPASDQEAPPGYEFVPTAPGAMPFVFGEKQPDAPLGIEGPIEGAISRVGRRLSGEDIERDDPLHMTRLGAIVTGSFAGAVYGAKAPGPWPVKAATTLGGGALGAYAGAVAPESFIEFGEEVGIVDPGTRKKIGLSPEELTTVAEGEALVDLAFGSVFTAARASGRTIAEVLTAGKKGTVDEVGHELASAASKHGIHLLPVQVGGRHLPRMFINVFGRFPLIGGPLKKRAQASEDALRRFVENIPDRLSPLATSWSDLSEQIHKEAGGLLKELNKGFGARYDKLFAAADSAGVRIVPHFTMGKVNEILGKINLEKTRFAEGGEAEAAKALKVVEKFLDKHITPIRATKTMQTGTTQQVTDSGQVVNVVKQGQASMTAVQSLRQMDALISKIDQKIASLEPSQARWARSLLIQLRTAAQKDGLVNIRGKDAGIIAREMRQIDTEFSKTMTDLFETATAKQFGSVSRRGLRGSSYDKTTRIPVDQLARIVVKLDSPQSIRDLAKIVTPETFKRISAQVMSDAVEVSMKNVDGVGKQFDIEVFSKRLGLNKGQGSLRKVVEDMLKRSNAGITIEDLDTVVKAGRAMASVEIPNVSTFIARRGTIGGWKAIVNGLVPGLAVAGGAAYVGVPLVGAVLAIGGGRLFSAIISKPESARLLGSVMRGEMTQVARRKAFAGILRMGVDEMQNKQWIDPELREAMDRVVDYTLDAFDKEYKVIMDTMAPEQPAPAEKK